METCDTPVWPSVIPLPTGTDVKEARVICVSTGTKCINGEYMSDRGLALNDCHAEIIARRSLIRYLYTQLEFFLRLVDRDTLYSVRCSCIFLQLFYIPVAFFYVHLNKMRSIF
ncbi:hypothetical protein XENORESO_013511 [Xenotaenia resolanae]|uniref:A to I editase domain-containing protein n=1 Tax=Xenotaenia resolanae TaxID=208358 RepID=A0ABV0WZG7_9TELE